MIQKLLLKCAGKHLLVHVLVQLPDTDALGPASAVQRVFSYSGTDASRFER